MTPLAHRLARALTNGQLPPDAAKLVAPALSAHFFEVTAALPLCDEVARAAAKSDGPFIPCSFLPAPRTWIEWQPPGAGRRAICFTKGDALDWYLEGFRAVPATWAVALYFFPRPLPASSAAYRLHVAGWVDLVTGQPHLNDELDDGPADTRSALEGVTQATRLLAIINSPRIVQRRTHPPRKTVARKLAQAGIDIGPLLPWHEIKLEVTKPRDIDDGEPHADVITGKRALHFCRKHLRLWNGRLIPIREHWRGDPSVGIRRGRYTVTAGQP